MSTIKKTVQSTEEAWWHKNDKLQEAVEKTEKCRVLHAADTKKTMMAMKSVTEETKKWEEAKIK